jgi:hypothetical protein
VVGGQALANGAGATAYGWRSEATAERATALGHLAVASGVRSVSVGEAATATGSGAIAMGNQSVASGANSVAIGNGARAVNDGQVVIAGLDTSTASQTGTVFAVTTDSNGTLGRSALATTASVAAANASIAANTASIGANSAAITTANANIASLQTLTSNQTAQINTLFGQTAELRDAVDRANEGVAMALAMESPMLPAGTNFGLSGGVGYYDDQAAGTLAVSARVGTNMSVGAGLGVGFDSGEVGARGGFQIAW